MFVFAVTEPSDWVKDYAKLLASPASGDWERACALKQAHAPAQLFRFRSPSTRSVNDIKDGTIWLAAPRYFNDPFDSAFSLDATLHLKRVFRKEPRDWLSKFSALPPELLLTLRTTEDPFALFKDGLVAEALKQSGLQAGLQAAERFATFLTEASTQASEVLSSLFQNHINVACFSETGTSLPLWAYYTDVHKGFCVEYNVSRLSPADSIFRMLHPVIYDSKRSALEQVLAVIANGGQPTPPLATLVALHKSPDWAHEREWRMVHPIGDTFGQDSSGIAIEMPTPSSLFFGNRMETALRRELAAIADTKKIPTFDMIISPHTFELQPIPAQPT